MTHGQHPAELHVHETLIHRTLIHETLNPTRLQVVLRQLQQQRPVDGVVQEAAAVGAQPHVLHPVGDLLRAPRLDGQQP